MTREQIFAVIRAHLADELEVDPDAISESTRFREDLEADSLDLYTLVQELEDTYGVTISEAEACQDPDSRTGGRVRARERRRGRAPVGDSEPERRVTTQSQPATRPSRD